MLWTLGCNGEHIDAALGRQSPAIFRPANRFRQAVRSLWPSVGSAPPTRRCAPRPSAGASSTKPRLGLVQLDHLQADAVRGGRGGGFTARRSPDRRSPPPPSGPSPPAPSAASAADLLAVAGVGRGDVQHQHLAQRVDRRMDLGVRPRSRARSRTRRDARSPDVLCRVALSMMTAVGWSARPALQRSMHAQIVHHGRETAGLDPALGLVVDRCPEAGSCRQAVRQGDPARTIQRKALKTSRRSCRR